ncbi:NlpC/P60 family protein [Salmonella enterica]|nr:NlpC/P60 family protein [Salmonella enterica]
MNLDIPDTYREQAIARRARRLYDQMRKGDNSRVRKLVYLPPARAIDVGLHYRLLSLDCGTTWKLFNHREYEKELRKWRKKKR